MIISKRNATKNGLKLIQLIIDFVYKIHSQSFEQIH